MAISEEAKTWEYIAIHHSDDIWEAQKLEKQVAFLDAHPGIGAIFTWAQIIDDSFAITRFSKITNNALPLWRLFCNIMGQEQFSKEYYANFLPLSPNKNGDQTLLQSSH
jgi:hypothetical protein